MDLALEVKRLRPDVVIDIISERESRHPRAHQAFDRIMSPSGAGWMRTTRGVKFLWYMAKYRALLARTDGRYDAVHVFYLSAIWGALANGLRARGGRLIVSLFGSDVYRTTGLLQPLQAHLLRAADHVTAANADTLDAASRMHVDLSERSSLVRFGLRPLEHVQRLRRTGDRVMHRAALGLPADRIIVVAGYNASMNQRHAAIIEALDVLPTALRDRLFVVLPMTMGGDEAYRMEVRTLIGLTGIPHRIFSDLMTDEDVARLRLAADILVQVQATDQLAGAMQEHLCAGTVVITGAWLPYAVLHDAGVRFWAIEGLNDLPAAVREALDELEARREQCQDNEGPILELSSWSHTAPRWSALYD
ncbi:MAG: hypothetical protein JNL05_06260 [Flavobacteriales bacterium]|nr:hypothetical protein [Flavobacteriales bacterium]